MSVRFFASVIGMAFVAGTTTLGIPPVSGQAPRAANTAKRWTPPRTSWGDPDLHGWFTNLNENGTPLERPDQFARHRLEDVNGKKLAALKQEVQKRMFDPYYQAATDLGEGRNTGFLGIGLTIAKEVVEAHNGTIKFSPNIPHGAVFTVSLPKIETAELT